MERRAVAVSFQKSIDPNAWFWVETATWPLTAHSLRKASRRQPLLLPLHLMELDEAPDPVRIRLLRPYRIVLQAHHLADLVQQLELGIGNHRLHDGHRGNRKGLPTLMEPHKITQ